MSRTEDLLTAARTQLFVGGAWTDAEGGRTFGVDDPATGREFARVADASPGDGARALDAAVAAQEGYAALPAVRRHEIVRLTFELLTERQEELALLMTLEMGKPLAESRGEIAYAAEFFRAVAGQALFLDGGMQVAPQGGAHLMTLRRPVGPCVLVTPWNFPMAMGARKLAPALAAGCTSVVKPAQQTPLSMLALADVLAEAGVPEGVVNVVPTSDAGALVEPLLRDGRTRKLSFTGSTAVGSRLLEQAAGTVMRTSMELGGNAPFLVLEDADVDAALEGCLQAKMRNTGEACTAANRIYVHESLAEDFAAQLAERMGALVVGPGVGDGSQVGPLIDGAALDKVEGLVRGAVEAGGRVLVGGERVGEEGFFWAPTVLVDVPAEAEIWRTEIFGPVAVVGTFSTEDEAVALANDTPYGLVAYAYTRDLTRGHRLAERLEAGMVGLNQGVVSNPYAPFGGVKRSGLGREGGLLGIEEYLEVRYVSVGLGGS